MPPPPETSFPGFTPAPRHAAVDLPVFDWYSYSSPLPPSPPPPNVPPATPPSPPPLPPNPPLEPVTPYVWVNMTADQVRRTLQLTSIFENSNTTLQYDYCGNQHDGRGYTFGYCGFTTRTGDGYQVVQRYTELEPTNILAPFIPELQVLMEQNSGKVQNLSGFCEAVAKAASDPAFQEAQNYVQDKLYFQPAMDLAEQIGIRLPLTKGQLYDAMIQHGEGLNDPFSIDYIIMSTSNATGGIPLLGVDETWWIQVFLYFRGITLERFYPQPHITERLSFYEQLMKDGNWNLEGPIYVDDVQHADGWTILDTYFGTFVIA